MVDPVAQALARPAKNTQGYQQGWTQSTKVTESGFIQQGIGLDSIMRGAKLDDAIPDLIVFDDIDERHDSPATTAKKIQIFTETILPYFWKRKRMAGRLCTTSTDAMRQTKTWTSLMSWIVKAVVDVAFRICPAVLTANPNR